MKNVEPEEYLNKDFDYTKLTKVALRKILFENNVSDIPSNIKKDELLEIYKANIHNKIDTIKKRIEKDKLKMENLYQNDRSSIVDFHDIKTPRKSSLAGKAVDNKFNVVDEKRQKLVKDKIEEVKNTSTKDLKIDSSFSKSFLSSKDSSLMEDRLSVIKNGPKSPVRKSDEEKSKSLIEDESKFNSTRHSLDSKEKPISPKKHEKTHTPSKLEQFLSSKHISNSNDDKIKEEDLSECSLYKNTITPITIKKNKIVNDKSKKKYTKKIFHFTLWVICFIGILFVSFLIFCFLKSLPYCRNGDFFCISVPENATLIGDRVVCKKGFVLKKILFFTFCVKDDSEEKKRNKLIKSIINAVELRNGEYKYGMVKSNKILIKDLSEDSLVIESLKKIPSIVISNEYIYSKKHKVSLRIVLRYYSKTAVYVLVPLLILLVLLKYKIKLNRIRRERNEASKKVVKDILEVLLRQLLISTKNKNFPSHVFVDQLKDVFGDDPNIWKIVDKMISKNSNVRSDLIDDKRVWEWIGPIICKQESIDHLMY